VVFTAGTMKYVVFWDVTPCCSCKNRRFGGTQRLLHQGDKTQWARNNVSRNKQTMHAAKKYKNLYFFARCVGCRFLQEPQGLTSQKTSFFIVTAVKTSDKLTLQNWKKTAFLLNIFKSIVFFDAPSFPTTNFKNISDIYTLLCLCINEIFITSGLTNIQFIVRYLCIISALAYVSWTRVQNLVPCSYQLGSSS
jgi:hypothetical protein